MAVIRDRNDPATYRYQGHDAFRPTVYRVQSSLGNTTAVAPSPALYKTPGPSVGISHIPSGSSRLNPTFSYNRNASCRQSQRHSQLRERHALVAAARRGANARGARLGDEAPVPLPRGLVRVVGRGVNGVVDEGEGETFVTMNLCEWEKGAS